ncbi:MAG: glutamine-hydrolyzing carbamoyl-phosphate synthase small subunit [Cytophagales bacterium]|nr:glutamine-hydrolyzing carbamoyl-phosphate synthase small subunit [Cytophagales bacterium]
MLSYKLKNKALLILEDGSVYEGFAAGAKGTTSGEMCFNTGMTGYQEIYTDPSYYGQIIINTTAHIGNYGVLDAEQESGGVQFRGLVCNYYSDIYSRKTSKNSLQQYFENNHVVAISGVDTRKLVRYIRSKGAMNGIISNENTDVESLKQMLKNIPQMAGLELSSEVSTKQPYFVGSASAKYKVAVLDLGVKKSILANFEMRDVYCKVFPARTTYKEMKEWSPNGYFISNGPGDPAVTDYAINTVKDILSEDNTLFGICLGHQILAEANGISTFKMHNGHRGLNHPVKNLMTGKSEITSQNHGFAVKAEAIDANDEVILTHINLNDGTVEGIKLKNKKAFSVQYHPEAGPGPHDSRYLFDDFVATFALK